MKRVLCLGATSLAVLAAVGLGISALERPVSAQASAPAGQGRTSAPPPPAPAGRAAAGAPAAPAGVPSYRVSPLWPKPLPNHWVFGAISGVAVDSRDHVWIVHRGADTLEANEKGMMATPPTSSVCCVAAPSVLEFDQAGTVLSSWGGPGLGFSWPQYTGGIAVDSKGNVWIAAMGLEPAAAGGAGGRGARGAPPADGAAAPAAPAAGGRGRGAAPAGGAPAGGAAPAPGGAAPAGGRGGAGGGAAGGAAAGGAAGGGAAAGGGRGGRGAGAAGGAAAGGAAPAAPPAAAAAPQDGAAPARGRGAPAAPAAPVIADAHVTKYSSVGTFVLQIGKPGEPGGGNTQLNRPTAIGLDEAANEVYIADSGNHRIVVFDSNTGAFKRQWGGSGDAPTAAGAGAYDPAAPVAKQFRDPYCVKIAKDGMVYVCDRSSNRIQVFQKNGTFVKEMVIEKDTKGATATIGSLTLNSSGSVWDVAFSSDMAQRYLFVADGANDRVLMLRRDTLAQVSIIGGGGRQAGRFLSPGSVAVDSHGTLYTGEQHHAKRVQKFVPATASAAPAAK